MTEIAIDQEKCTQCGACVALCNASNVYEQIDGETRVIRLKSPR